MSEVCEREREREGRYERRIVGLEDRFELMAVVGWLRSARVPVRCPHLLRGAPWHVYPVVGICWEHPKGGVKCPACMLVHVHRRHGGQVAAVGAGRVDLSWWWGRLVVVGSASLSEAHGTMGAAVSGDECRATSEGSGVPHRMR